jgi:hypothetical protein
VVRQRNPVEDHRKRDSDLCVHHASSLIRSEYRCRTKCPAEKPKDETKTPQTECGHRIRWIGFGAWPGFCVQSYPKADTCDQGLLCRFAQISFLSLVKMALARVLVPEETHMLLLIIILVLLFGGGGGYYGFSRWGTGGGLGIVGTVLLIVLVLYLFGAIRI